MPIQRERKGNNQQDRNIQIILSTTKLVSGLVVGLVGGLVIVRLSLTFVLDLSDVTRVAIDVIVDDLAAAVGENNEVRSLGVVTFALLVVAHIDVGVVVLDGVVEGVVSGGLKK